VTRTREHVLRRQYDRLRRDRDRRARGLRVRADELRGKNILFALFLATYMMPGEAPLIPNFVMMSKAPPA
jgi:hypothetical protein